MIINLMQIYLFLCIYAPINAMLDYSVEKAHVHSMLFDKYSIVENNDIIPKSIIKPSPKKLNSSKIIENHVQSLFDDQHKKENFSHHFINKIILNKNSSLLISHLAKTQLYPKIITELNKTAENNSMHNPDLDYIIAELYYHHADYQHAHEFYSKNNSYFLTTKNANINAVNSYLMVSNNLCKQDIPYISSLSGNIYTYLTTSTQTDALLSYKIGLLAQTFLDSNPIMDISKKESIMLKALEHLTYAEKNGTWNAEHVIIKQMCAKLYHELFTLYQSQKNYDASLAHIQHADDYVDKLASLLPANKHLWLKAQIYNGTQKTLPHTELETILKLFSNSKKPSIQQQEIIRILLLSYTDFFIQTKNYPLALKVVNKLAALQNSLTLAAIWLAYDITKHLNDTNHPYKEEWQQNLNVTAQLFQDPSHHDGNTNVKIGYLLSRKSITPDYAIIMPYFTAGIDSNELSESTYLEIKELCALFYRNWAIQKNNSSQTSLDLFDKAIQYDNTELAYYEKAVFILENCNDQQLIQYAIEILEDNIQHNKSTTLVSQLQLAQAYLHHSKNPQQIPILKQYIPLNIEKAITYLKAHNNDKTLLIIRCAILTGTSSYIDTDTAKQYIDYNEALHVINLLIDLYGISAEYIAQRLYIFEELNRTEELYIDIDYLLSVDESLYANSFTKQQLCLRKIELLLDNTPDDNAYYKALECLKTLQSYQEDSCINFNALPSLQKQTRHFVKNNIMTDYAIEWCYFGVLSEMANIVPTSTLHNKTTPMTANEQKDLALYLLSAAKIGNIYAQLVVLPYFKIVDTIADKSTISYQAYDYAHTALCNNDHNAYTQISLNLLIHTLKKSAENGIALAYYILCDYYKNDHKQLENLMLLFSKAKTQYHYIDNTTETIEKACISCRSALRTYVDPFLINPEKASLLSALATFTLGSMYLYSDRQDIFTPGTYYVHEASEQLLRTFKLSHYGTAASRLLGNVLYKDALLAEKNTGTIDSKQLLDSARLDYLPAIHKLAELYIQQHTQENTHISINSDNFLYLLRKDVQSNNPCNEKSLNLLEECMKIQEKIHKKQTPTTAIKSNNNPETNPLIIAAHHLEKQGSKDAKLVLEQTIHGQSKQSADIFSTLLNTTQQDTKEKMRQKRELLQRRKPKK